MFLIAGSATSELPVPDDDGESKTEEWLRSCLKFPFHFLNTNEKDCACEELGYYQADLLHLGLTDSPNPGNSILFLPCVLNLMA